MIWRIYQDISAVCLTAAIFWIGLLFCGLSPDGAAMVGGMAGLMLTTLARLRDNDND